MRLSLTRLVNDPPLFSSFLFFNNVLDSPPPTSCKISQIVLCAQRGVGVVGGRVEVARITHIKQANSFTGDVIVF